MTEKLDIDLELSALLDGALETDRARAVETRLAADARLAARYAAMRSDKAMLKDLYGPLQERPLPQAWLSRIEESRRPKPLLPWHLAGAIAAVLLVALGAIAGYRALAPREPAGIVDAALAARAHPDGQEIAVNDANLPKAVLNETKRRSVS